MDKYQVRACLEAGEGLSYVNAEGSLTGVFAIDTTGANDGDVLSYSSGTVGWTPGGGGGSFWSLTGNGGTDATVNFLGTTDAQDLVIKTDNTERVRVLSTGNVGIGTNAPAFRFHVEGSYYQNNYDGSNLITTINGVNLGVLDFSAGSVSSNNGSNINLAVSTLLIQWADVPNVINPQIKLNTNSISIGNSGTAPSSDIGNIFTILNSNNNIGIGTSSPTQKLHVAGTVRIEDGTQAAGYVLTSDADGVASWQPSGGGGSVAWGAITGTLSDQTDLQTALDGKFDDPTGTTSEYIRGDGTLATFPTIPTVTPSALTKTDDTNVTLTLVGTPGTALLQSVSLNLGWTGQLSIARGGTGLGTLGTANQLLRVNAGATALEYFTPTYISGLTVGTTTIASGTAGRLLFEGSGNVLQENSLFNVDTTNGMIIGGATARGTRLTVVNSANTQATKIFVQRNAADSADYTTLRGDGSVDFANIGSTANVLVYANGSSLIQTYGSAGLRNSMFGLANVTSITGGTVAYNTFVGAESTLSGSTGTIAYNTAVGFTTNITNSNNCTIVGTFTRMNGATRAIVIGGRSTAGPVRDVTGTDVILFGYGTDANALNYTNSGVFYFNNANASHWFHGGGNLGLFGKKYQILNDSTGTAANRLNTYMDINATNTVTIHNGTAPAVNITDAFQMYGADIVAGNTAAHFRTENGAIIKLYQETTSVGSATVVSPGAGSNIKTDDTFDGYTLQQIVKALRNQGLLA